MDSYKEMIYRWLIAYMTSLGLILWGKSSPSPPPPPDPTTIANAQSTANQQTAAYQAGLNNPNVFTPLGSNVRTAANAAGTTALNANPQYNQTISLTPQGQQLYGQQLQQQLGMSSAANQLLPQVQQAFGNQQLNSSADINQTSKNASDAYYNQQKAYLDPQWQNNQDRQNAQLANQGVMAGSQAYNTAQDELARQKAFAYNQAQQGAITQGPGVAGQNLQLQAANTSLPLNQLSALMSGSQVQMPQFSGTTPTNVNPSNPAGYAYQSYGGLQDIYNQQIGQQNATTSGLTGLAGSGLAAYGMYAGMAAM